MRRLGTMLFWALLLTFLVPAVCWTGLRILQPEAGWAVRATAFVPLAAPAYAAVIVLGLLRAAVRTRWARAGLIALVLLACAGLGAHLSWFLPQWIGRVPDPAADAEPFRVATLNAYAGNVPAAEIAELADAEQVDVLVIEEITRTLLVDLDASGVLQRYPYQAGEPSETVSGTMVFSAFPIDDVAKLDTPFGSWGMSVAGPNGSLRLYGVHPRPPVGSAAGWRQDLAAIRAAVSDADLVAGDFNATPDQQPMLALRESGLRSAAELANAGWSPTWPANGMVHLAGVTLPRLVQIDHVLVGERLTVVEVSRRSMTGSDHDAVIAEVAAR